MLPLENLIDPFKPAETPPPQSLPAFLRWLFTGAGGVLFLAALLSGAVGAMEAVSAWLLGKVVDTASAVGPRSFFDENGIIVIGFVGFFLLLRPALFSLSAMFVSVVVTPSLFPMAVSRLNRHTLKRDIAFFDNDFAGRVAQKQMQTARAATDVVVEIINVVVFALMSFGGAFALLATIDWRAGIVMLVWVVAYLATIRMFMPRFRKVSAKRAGARALVTGQLVDTITNIKTVKLFAHSAFEDRAALEAIAAFRKTAISFGRVAFSFRGCLTLLSGVLPVVLVLGTLWLWSLDQASAGDVAAAGVVSFRIGQMTGWVSFALMALYSNIGEIEDGMRTLGGLPALEDAEDAEVLKGARDIAFRDVSFAYGRRTGGVSQIDLTVCAGEKLGIVGASGAGKSTLVSLLMRLYDTEKGSVSVGSRDVRALTQESLRRHIGMVTQETAMFNRSARDNILYGRPDASKAEMIGAARKAAAHAFILGLEDHKGNRGYDAFLGERGVKLSGGQRQRIALARAILKDAPILVLDEATSALDSEVEAEIQTALEEVMQGKTVLAIAHRLSTLVQMDRIVVLDQGRIVEEGSHEALLAAGGLYARYWARQSGGFLGAEDDE